MIYCKFSTASGKDIGMTESKVKMKFYPVFLVNKKYLNLDIKNRCFISTI